MCDIYATSMFVVVLACLFIIGVLKFALAVYLLAITLKVSAFLVVACSLVFLVTLTAGVLTC
jgi:hypothetical protein